MAKSFLSEHVGVVVSGVAGTLLSAAAIWIFTVGGFVTNKAYADDNKKLDQIITLITKTDANQTSERKHATLDAAITNSERRIEELTLYIEADPMAALAATRKANVRRLQGVISDAKRDKNELLRVERLNNQVSN